MAFADLAGLIRGTQAKGIDLPNCSWNVGTAQTKAHYEMQEAFNCSVRNQPQYRPPWPTRPPRLTIVPRHLNLGVCCGEGVHP